MQQLFRNGFWRFLQTVQRSMGKFGDIRRKEWVDFHPFSGQTA